MAFHRGPDIVTDGLVSYYDAANLRSYPGTGTNWGDLIGTVDSTLYNSPTFSDRAIVFDGIDDYAQMPSNSIWAVGSNATIAMWCKFTGSITTNHRLFCVNNNTSSLDAYLNSADGRLGLHGGNTLTTSEFPLDSWVNLVITYTSGTIKIYFNGVSQTLSGTTTGFNITNSNTLYLGKYTLASGFRWRGSIATFSTHNQPLSLEEIQQNYNNTKSRFGL